MITVSTDWSAVEANLRHKVHGFSYENDVRKLLNNISHTVTELSKAEVDYRRGKKRRAEELLQKVNQDIEMVEEYILLAALIG